MNKKRIKVAIGMSGGVDSSVAAKLLVDQGYEVVGFMMKFWADPLCLASRDNACCDPQSVEDAKRVAEKIGIPFYVIDAREEFKQSVVDYFIEEYKNYRTPNPCVVCNEKIKFGWFLKFAKSLNCEYVATGHYARIVNNSSELKVKSSKLKEEQKITYRLFKGVDSKKDQSYFLHRLNQEQLSHVLLPLGEMTKDKVRLLAKKWNLPVGEKKESQEVCFIMDKDYRAFLQRYLPTKYFSEGEIVDTNSSRVGIHNGLINFTIGQRRGINQTELVTSRKYQASSAKQEQNIAKPSLQTSYSKLPTDKQPLYVLGVNQDKNQLIVGTDKELFRKGMTINNLKWTRQIDDLTKIANLKVKIRYRASAVACSFKAVQKRKKGDQVVITFLEQQRAITPGQSAVFYDGEEVLGGGLIEE